MAGDQKGELSKKDKFFLEEFTVILDKVCKDQMRKFRQDIQQQRKSRSSRDEYKKKEFDQMDRNQKHAGLKFQIPSFLGEADPTAYVEWEEKMELIFKCQSYSEVKKIQIATAEFYGYASSWWNQLVSSRRHYGIEPVATWLKLRALMHHKYVPRQYHKEVLQKQFEARLCSSILDRKQQGSMRSTPTSVISLSSKTTNRVSKEDIKELSQLIKYVGKPLKRTNTTRPFIEAQLQEPVTTVSELQVEEPVSDEHIQEDQAKESSPTIQKEEQPVQDVMVPIIQDVKEEEAEALMEPQSDRGLNQLIVFDLSDFQKTFLSTFLISPFVWNKTRAVELLRHKLGMKQFVFEPGGELCNLRNKNKLIEKKSATSTIDFVDFSSSEDKVLHVSSQQDFHYKTNCRMFTTQSLIQQTRPRSKWPPDHQDIANFAKHIDLDQFREMLISDWVGRLQTYLWRPGAYVSIFIFLEEHSARARIILGYKELEAGQNALLLDHVKIWKPPDMQQLQNHYKDYQTMSGG
ncbi:uncharacterized protein LOC125579856 [Brassica napus]|uniref:uncharacterized protein LOC125579856 n=1 Tax=Brassica napus TaxID=3708 RepID=UPI002078D862|nr:uncharacterized protein LOC125579856 [Brassica napus]